MDFWVLFRKYFSILDVSVIWVFFSFSFFYMKSGFKVMGERIPPGSYFQYPPPGVPASPHRSSPLSVDRERSVQFILSVLSC